MSLKENPRCAHGVLVAARHTCAPCVQLDRAAWRARWVPGAVVTPSRAPSFTFDGGRPLPSRSDHDDER